MSLLDFVSRIFFMRWLWSMFAGFYLVAYTFWIPNLFNEILIIISLSIITLIIGGGLLLEGIRRALSLEKQNTDNISSLPRIRLWWLIGGFLLIGYTLVYIPQEGRVVAHWPLDLAITVESAIIILTYAAKGVKKN